MDGEGANEESNEEEREGWGGDKGWRGRDGEEIKDGEGGKEESNEEGREGS